MYDNNSSFMRYTSKLQRISSCLNKIFWAYNSDYVIATPIVGSI